MTTAWPGTRATSRSAPGPPPHAGSPGTHPLTFESSPYYLFHPLAAARISRDLPGVKLVVLVRDPVERAYSAHAHELARGFETEPFERALDLEEARLAGQAEKIIADPGYHSHSHQHHGYRARGRYADQLERLAQLVGRDRVHVVDSRRLLHRSRTGLRLTSLSSSACRTTATPSSSGTTPVPAPRHAGVPADRARRLLRPV